MPVRVLAGVQHDGFLQTGAEAVPQHAQPAKVLTAHPAARLDLEGDHLAVIAFKDEIGFVARFGAEVPGRNRRVRPADLLEDLPDCECLQEVAVLGEGRGCRLGDLLRGEVEQPGAAPIRIGAESSEPFMEPFYAADQGIFTRNGVTATAEAFGNGSVVLNAVIGNALDIGNTDLIPIANAVNHGFDLAIIASGGLHQQNR